MNIPNIITTIRVLLIPLFIIFLLYGQNDFALLTFMVAGASDALDGFLARVLRQKSVFGAYVDPVADKLLITTSYVILAILGNLPGWLAVLVVSRDIIIVGGIGILMLNNRTPDIKPTFISKVTTFFQLITICFIMGQNYLPGYWFLQSYFIFLVALLTMVTGFHYIFIGFGILGTVDDNRQS